MQRLTECVAHDLATLRAQSPLVHNITNYVVMNFSSNVLLSLGASPVMAHAPEEVEDMVSIAGALVLLGIGMGAGVHTRDEAECGGDY